MSDDVTELHNDLLRRAEACDEMTPGRMESERDEEAAIDRERLTAKASAYRHAAELLRASPVAAEGERLRAEIDALRSLLAAAARGELPGCDDCGTRLATLRWSDTSDCACDECLRDLRDAHASAGEEFDESARVDLPHAAALRAAIGGAK